MDLIRSISVIFILGLHISPMPFENNAYALVTFQSVLRLCNAFFFMLSGYFNIPKEFNEKRDYYKYYSRRFITVGFPVLLISLVSSIQSCINGTVEFTGIGHFLREYYILIITSAGGYWFILYLVGFLASVPIYSKAFKNMKFWELKILLGISLVWMAFYVYFTKNIGLEFGYDGWALFGYATCFFLGYYCAVMPEEEKSWPYYLAGILAFGITVYFCVNRYLHQFTHRYDYQPCFTIYALASFIFIMRRCKLKDGAFGKLCSFVGKHSFTVFLLHGFFLSLVLRLTSGIANSAAFYFATLSLLFAASLAGAFLLDSLIIFPCEKLLKKLLRV